MGKLTPEDRAALKRLLDADDDDDDEEPEEPEEHDEFEYKGARYRRVPDETGAPAERKKKPVKKVTEEPEEPEEPEVPTPTKRRFLT